MKYKVILVSCVGGNITKDYATDLTEAEALRVCEDNDWCYYDEETSVLWGMEYVEDTDTAQKEEPEATKKVVYIEFYNADTGAMEWREFFPAEIDELMRIEIIDNDSLGYAMDDKEAFDTAMAALEASGRTWTYGEFVREYLDHTDHEIRIRA